MYKKNNVCCCIFSIIGSLMASAGIAAIYYAGLITTISALLYITLILGIIGIIYVIFNIFCGGKPVKNNCFITSIVGSIITSIFGLTATSLAVGAFTSAILIGSVSFFLVSIIIYGINEAIGTYSSCDE